MSSIHCFGVCCFFSPGCASPIAFSSAPGLVEGLADVAEGVVPLVGVIPCGSGNGVAASLGVKNPLDAVLDIVHSLRTQQSTPMTLMEYGRVGAGGVDGPRDGVSACGLQWGLVADIDLGTEHMRWMGDTRFDVGAVGMILRKRAKYARVRLTLAPERQAVVDERLAEGGGGSRGRKMLPCERAGGGSDFLIEDRFVTVVAWAVSHQSLNASLTPYADVGEPCFDVAVCRANVLGRPGMLKMLLQIGDGSDKFLRSSNGMEYYKCTRISVEGDVVDEEGPTGPEGVYMTIDGERVPMEATYLRLAPENGMLRLLTSAASSAGAQ